MEAMPPDDRTEVIERLRQYALKRTAPEQVRLFLPFVERYYERVAAEDLVARAVEGRAGSGCRGGRRRGAGDDVACVAGGRALRVVVCDAQVSTLPSR